MSGDYLTLETAAMMYYRDRENDESMPEVRTWRDLAQDLEEGRLNPPEQIIQGMLYRGGKLLLSAPSKARKTWMLLHLAAAVAGGRDWLGFQTARCPVLYLDLELLPHETPHRLREIAKAADLRDVENLFLWQLRGFPLNLETLKPKLVQLLSNLGAGLLIIDPWYKLSGGADEIGTEGVAATLSELEAIAREADCSVAIAHHFTKGDSSQKSVIDLASGSGVFGRDPDVIAGVRELKDSSEENPLVMLEFAVRSFAPVPPIGLRWDFPLWVRDQTAQLELKTPGTGPGRPTKGTVQDILSILGSKEMTVGDWGDLCAATLGISSRTFKGIKAQAKRAGRIVERDEGRKTYCVATNAIKEVELLHP